MPWYSQPHYQSACWEGNNKLGVETAGVVAAFAWRRSYAVVVLLPGCLRWHFFPPSFSSNHVPPFLGSVGMQMRGGEAKNSPSSFFLFFSSPQHTESGEGSSLDVKRFFFLVLQSAGKSWTVWIQNSPLPLFISAPAPQLFLHSPELCSLYVKMCWYLKRSSSVYRCGCSESYNNRYFFFF